MGELEKEYGDKVVFNIISADETEKRQDEIDKFGFTALRHGLVVFGPDGKVEAKLPGHQFERSEIEAAMKGVL